MLFFRGDVTRCEHDNTSMDDGSLAPIDLDGVSDVEATLASPATMLTIFGLHKITLPIDIIYHIIDIGTFDSGDIEDYMLFPLRMSHVCRTWRGMTLNTSRLWRTITYKGPPKLPKLPLMRGTLQPPTEYYPLICLFLERSEERSIDIHLDLRQPDYNYSVVEHDVTGKGHPIDNLLSVLTPHASRIKTFTFISNNWTDVVQVLRHHIYALNMPNLERFELTRAHLSQTFRPTFDRPSLGTWVPFCVQPIDMAQLLASRAVQDERKWPKAKQVKWPMVKHVVLIGVPLAWRLWSFYGLTSLKLNYLAGNELLSAKNMRHVFRAVAPALRQLEIHGSSPVADDSDKQSQVELPRLEMLSIGFARTAQVTWLTKTLLTPALTSLEIVDIFQCYYQYCRHVEAVEPKGEPSTRDVTKLCSEMLEHMPFPLDKITRLTLRYLILGQLGGEDFVPAVGTDNASLPPAARFLLSLPALDTLTLESTDFERLAVHLFRNPVNLPKRNVRALEVLTCSPWRMAFDGDHHGAESKTSRLKDGKWATVDGDMSNWMALV